MTCGSRYSALILVNSITGLNLRAVLEVYTKISAHLSFFSQYYLQELKHCEHNMAFKYWHKVETISSNWMMREP